MDDRVRTTMQEALGVEQPDAGMRSRVLSSLPVEDRPPSRWQMPSFQWAGGLLAVVLGVAIVAGLLYIRGFAPAHTPATGTVSGHVTMTAQLGFKCTLPVTAYNNTYAQIQLPEGAVVNVSTAPASGTGKGVGGPYSYDVHVGKWLPVSPNWISPDGKSYAYGTQTTGVPGQGPTGTVHVVDVASGRDRQLWTGDGAAQVLGFQPHAVYFMKQSYMTPAQEIWVVDPANAGSAHRVGPNPPPPAPSPDQPWAYGPSTYFGTIGPLGAFGQGFNTPADRSKPATGAFFPDRIVRMDLASGNVSTWYVNPSGGQVSLIGLDAQGHPVLAVSNEPAPNPGPDGSGYKAMVKAPPSHILLLTGENQWTEIAPGTDPAFMPLTASGDSHGIWITVPGSIWLWDKSAGLRKVFTVPDALFPMPMKGGYAGGSPPPGAPTPPPGMPTGPYLMVAGACT